MAYCPVCGGNNTQYQNRFNLYGGGDYICVDCNINFYYGYEEIDEDDEEIED